MKTHIFAVFFLLSLAAALDTFGALVERENLNETEVVAYYSNTDQSSGLQEFTPIRNTITQSGTQYYSFSVNSSTGLGEYYEYLVFLTGNICLQPDDLAASANESLTVYYSFNSLMLTDLENSEMTHFDNGYFQALAEVAVSSTSLILYIGVRAPESTNTSASWSYEIGVSQNDLVYQWDDRSFTQVVDTDDQGVLIVTGNLTTVSNTSLSDYNASQSSLQLLVFDYAQKNHFATLNSSWCAVRNGPYINFGDNYLTSYTSRGGMLRQQFYVSGLNASSKYVAYLVSDLSGSLQGGTLYKQFEFETMSDNACRLLYDFEFCSEVAYLVPALSLEEYNSLLDLRSLYDDRALDLYANFSKALQQIACNTTSDAIFSPLRSCDDCSESYKNWLCAVTIPRCSTRNITGTVLRAANKSRNAFIDDYVVPPYDYYEVLPCVNVCLIMVRDCPADFAFACPGTNATMERSYSWDFGGMYSTCNFVGTLVEESAALAVSVAWKLLLVSIAFVMMAI